MRTSFLLRHGELPKEFHACLLVCVSVLRCASNGQVRGVFFRCLYFWPYYHTYQFLIVKALLGEPIAEVSFT